MLSCERVAKRVIITAGLFLASGGCGPKVWVEETVTQPLPMASVTDLSIKTHNGKIGFEGRPDISEGQLTISKRAGGRTQKQAEEAMDAIEVTVENTGDGKTVIGWKWSVPKAFGWGAQVGFDVVARPDVNLKARTHNGQIKVAGLNGDVELATHNGGIDLHTTSSSARVETHNGHIVARLDCDGGTSGSIATHNGGIQVTVGDSVSSIVACETHNGAITLDPAFHVTQVTKRRADARIGDGEGRLKLDTHNGSISIKRSTEPVE